MKIRFLSRHFVLDDSMAPTLEKGTQLIMRRSSKRSLRRIDIVAFRPRSGAVCHQLARIIGLPGDKVELCSKTVFVNGRRLYEPYVDPQNNTYSYKSITLGPDEYWLMGDNRLTAIDSRRIGPVKLSDIPAVLLWEVKKGGNK
ncbi:MAG: signal peptidase I [Oscillospiraceae bacterium]|nr:signal peptidase I [Oscillospiraceae bacterium]